MYACNSLRCTYHGTLLYVPKASFNHSVHSLQDRLKRIKKEHGSFEMGKVDVNMVIGGMRGVTVRRDPPFL